MGKISDVELEVAINNQDYQKIMGKASKSYCSVLSFDEIESCKLLALWRALEKYNPEVINKRNKQSKFTSFLYRGVQLECKTAVKFVLSGNKMKEPLHENLGAESKDIESIELIDEIRRTPHGDIIIDMYYNGLTTKELAEKFGVSKQIITVRKKRALKSLKARLE